MKRLPALLLCAVCLCSAAFAAADTARPRIGSGLANTVTVAMHEGVTADVALAQGSVSKDQAAADILSGAGDGLIAAVSGGFFNADYNKTSIDGYGAVARCLVNIVKDGALVNGSCAESAVCLGFTEGGGVLIDEVEISLYASFGGRRTAVQSVNDYYPDKADAILLFTPEAGYDLPVPASAKAAKIVDGTVTEIMSAGKMVCAADTYYFVCGKDRLQSLPAVGAAVSFSTEFSKAGWSGVTTAVACGPWLLHDGADALGRNSGFDYLAAQSISADAVGARTFAAVLASGDLMLGSCTASPRQIARYLLSIGARDAMLLDGGASSLLYANGAMLTSTERRLNNVLCIYDAARPDVRLSGQKLSVDGEGKAVEAYNIDGSNYFKLRDVAALLNSTGSQFSVGYDEAKNTVSVRTGAPYQRQSGDLLPGGDRSDTAVPSAQAVQIDGKASELTAYNIGGYNYFKLRDLGALLNFDVDYDEAARTVLIKSRQAP